MNKKLVILVVVSFCFCPYCTFGGLFDGLVKTLAKGSKAGAKTAIKSEAQAEAKVAPVAIAGLRGIAPNIAEYRKAAEQGDAEAQYNLGCCYELGRGVARNKSEAAKWYSKAAEQGHDKALYALIKLGKEPKAS